MRAFKVGVQLPIHEGGMGEQTPRWRDFVMMARRAEAVGLDSIWVPDHLLIRTDTDTMGVWAALPVLSGLAATTTRVELGPLVACSPFYNPALLAKMADTIDEISAGRFVLGLGAGNHEPEFRAFGFPFDRRVARFEESLRIIAPLLREGRVDFDGRFVSARDCELRPRGPRPGGPPIMIAGRGPRMLELVARHADRWNATYSYFNNDPDEFARLNADLNASCAAVGRDPATLQRTAAVYVRSYAAEIDWTDRFAPLAGSPEDLAAGLRAFHEAGADEVIVVLQVKTIEGIEALAPVLALLDRG